MDEAAAAKEEALRFLLRENSPLLVAYSGGVDSAYLLAVAVETLGHSCCAVIADSPSLPRSALRAARELAQDLGAQLEVIGTTEMLDENYTRNPPNRCYFCKAELFTRMDALARERNFRAIAYGENADDLRQVRPGRKAAEEFQVLAPLKQLGLTKSEIRALSRRRGLPTADLPAQPCLSSRIPHGTPVTAEALAMIERAEELVRARGFRVFRVRHEGNATEARARIEIAPEEMPRLSSLGEALVADVREAGYATVVLDPRGYRSGVS